MQKRKRLVLLRERLRNLTPLQLRGVAGGEPDTASQDGLCDSIVACAPGTQNTLNTLNTITALTLNTIDDTIIF
jgi:hypothetical protein